MNTKQKTLLIASLTILLVGAAFTGYTLYERRVSTDVRAAVLATLGNNVSDADAVVYLRTAKLASRTKRDTYVVGLLDNFVKQAMAAGRDNREVMNLLTKHIIGQDWPVECKIYGIQTLQCRMALKQQRINDQIDIEMEKNFQTRADTETKSMILNRS